MAAATFSALLAVSGSNQRASSSPRSQVICRLASCRVAKIARQSAHVIDSEKRAEIVQRNRSVAVDGKPDEERLGFPATDLKRISALISGAKFSK